MALLGCCASVISAQALAQDNSQLRVLKMLERSSSSPATMCFVLDSRQSIVNDTQNLMNFVKVTPQPSTDTVASMEDNMLCVSGLDSGRDYTLNLKQGLKLTSGKILSADVNVPFTISDAQAQIKLPYNMILPKNNTNNSFVIETLNQPSFKLNIYRLSTRSLNDLDLYELLNSNITNYSLVSLLNSNARLVYSKTFDLSSGKPIEIKELDDSAVFTAQNTTEKAKTSGGKNGFLTRSNNTNEAANSSNPQSLEQKIALYKSLPENLRNQPIKTEIKLSDFVEENDDGIYLILAADSRIDISNHDNLYSYNTGALPLSAKLLMFTDLGLTTYKSADGLLANVRSLTGAGNISGVKIELIAANNEILASGFTDDTGTVHFGKEVISGENALRPIALIARTSKDVYSMDLRSSPLYIEGNQNKIKSVDGFETFAYTDRGIYRPSEVVHYTSLVRNTNLQALDAPLTLTIYNHQGNEVERVLLTNSKSGGYEYDFKIAKGSGLGSYRAVLSLGKKQLADTKFAVSSMVPLQINSEIINDESMISIDAPYTFKSRTNFNYGSNAANLSGQFTITRSPDLNPIISPTASFAESIKGFHFGADEREQSSLTKSDQFYSLRTDVEGILQQQVNFKSEDYPQKITVTSQVFDTNGQAATAARSYKLSFNRPLIGIKQLPVNDGVSFALCSYLQDGSTFPQDVKYYLYKEFTDYNFVLEDGVWKYVTFKSKKLISQGQAKVDNQNLNQALIKTKLEDGNYFIELKSDKSYTAYAFSKGFSSSNQADTPDTIQVFADKQLYNAGENAVLSFDSPFNGFANLVVGRQTISSFKTFSVKRGRNTIKVPLNDELFPQGHVLLSLYAPMTGQNTATVRVIGTADLNMDLSSHEIELNANMPEFIKPESTLTVKLQAIPTDPKAQLKEPYAKLTLVDNGILQLTNYQSPDPNKVLSQDRIFNVQMFDAYGYIMQDPKQQGQGYGATAEGLLDMQTNGSATALFDTPIKSTALASKIVPLDNQGQAQVDFEIPQFSGSLKLMAVAWDQDKTGSTQKDIAVHDQAVASLGLPRFLNLDDEAIVRLNLHNLKSTDPNFKIDVSCSGALQCSQQSVLNLKAGARNDVFFKLKGLEQGTGNISLKVMNKEFKYDQDYQLTVTSPRLPMFNTQSYYIEPNSSVSLDLSKDYTNIQGAMVSTSALPNVNPDILVRQIDSFNWGLQDQIASLESKLLYGSRLLEDLTLDQDSQKSLSSNEGNVKTSSSKAIHNPDFYMAKYRSQAELNDAIQELVDRVSAQLNASMAGNNDFNQVYATDILLKANAQGFNVNLSVLERQFEQLRKMSNNFGNYSIGTYANAVLSRIESINPASLRYALDERELTQPLQLAYLAQTLEQIGDHNRAANALEQAITNLLAWQQGEQKLNQESDQNKRQELLNNLNKFRYNSTSLIHDAYVVLDTCLTLNKPQMALDLINKLPCISQQAYFLSPASMAVMLRTNYDLNQAQGLTEPAVEPNSSATNTKQAQTANTNVATAKTNVTPAKTNASNPQSEQVAQTSAAEASADNQNNVLVLNSNQPVFLDAQQAALPLSLRNDSNKPMFKTISVLGSLNHDKLINNGVAIRINYFNKSEKIDLNNYNFRLNEEVLMEVLIHHQQDYDADSIVKIKLPAGFEFVRTAVPNDPSFAQLLNNPNITYTKVETGDDIAVAKFSRYEDKTNRALLLVLRAALPGTYSQGEALVQMQQIPQIFGTYQGTEKLKVQTEK